MNSRSPYRPRIPQTTADIIRVDTCDTRNPKHVFSQFRQKSSKIKRENSPENSFFRPKSNQITTLKDNYKTDLQSVTKKVKKSSGKRYAISKKYYLCHRKNDETFIETYADIAQLVEQLICNQPVVGSSPTIGSEA